MSANEKTSSGTESSGLPPNDNTEQNTLGRMTTKTRSLLQWELRWIPVEMLMVGFGLFLQLGLHLDEAGAFFLFLAVLTSGIVRWRHYLRKSGESEQAGN